MAKVAEDIIERLVKNPEFVDNMKKNIKEIMKDGKIDISDVPEIVLVITDCVEALNNINISKNNLPIVIKGTVLHVIKENKLVKDDDLPLVEKYIDVALKMLTYKLKAVKALGCLCFKK
jgi:hypothetical protein